MLKWVFIEKECEIWMINPIKKYIPWITEYQPQVKNVCEREIIYVDPRSHGHFTNESEMRRH